MYPGIIDILFERHQVKTPKQIIQDSLRTFWEKVQENRHTILSYVIKGIVVGGSAYLIYKQYQEINKMNDKIIQSLIFR